MMVQNRYQRRRMYTRIALGKNRAMDVVSGESSGGSGQLLILYPMLFALQLLQCWIGARSARCVRPQPQPPWPSPGLTRPRCRMLHVYPSGVTSMALALPQDGTLCSAALWVVHPLPVECLKPAHWWQQAVQQFGWHGLDFLGNRRSCGICCRV